MVEGLTPEEQAKLDACKTPEEMLALAKEVGYELDEEELEAVSGGGFYSSDPYKVRYCPTCDLELAWHKSPKRGWECPRCRKVFSESDTTSVVWKWAK